jgi:hypothetical protein
MAHSKSSPLMVLRFSRWHLSLALRKAPAQCQRRGTRVRRGACGGGSRAASASSPRGVQPAAAFGRPERPARGGARLSDTFAPRTRW